jgi:hypothetical protein
MAGRRGKIWRGAPVVAIGDDELRGIDVDRSTSGPGYGRGEDGRGYTLAARDEKVQGPRFEVTEDGDRTAEVAVFTRGGIDRCEQRAPCGTGRHEIFRRLAVTAQEHRRGPRGVVAALRSRAVCAPEKEVGHASERRRDDNEGTGMRRDERRRAPNGGRIRQGCAAEFPYFDVSLVCGHVTDRFTTCNVETGVTRGTRGF